MNRFLHQLLQNFGKNLLTIILRPRNLVWHLAAILLTALLVLSGSDWAYFRAVNGHYRPVLFAAATVGGLLPILLPITMYFAYRRRSASLTNTAFALGQAALLAWIISSTYKALTGRLPPNVGMPTGADLSRDFLFGFWRNGIFWGWPSSHTMVAFAMSFALITLYPKSSILKVLAIAYGFFIGIGVSFGAHWLSEFIAGALMGIPVGLTVGRSFAKNT